MKEDGVERAVAFTQYPQWSCTTTGGKRVNSFGAEQTFFFLILFALSLSVCASVFMIKGSLNELWRQLKRLNLENTFKWSVIDRWNTHPIFIDAVAQKIKKSLDRDFPNPEDRNKCVILFSAHSLPHKVINKGDTYPQEVGATVQKVVERLQALNERNRFLLSYQSQVGPVAWLGPQTVDVVQKLGKAGERNVLVVPIAFTSDHIETLFEIDVEIKHAAKESGVANFFRSESLNDDQLFVEAQADIVKAHLESGELHSLQYPLRCPGCVNPDCRDLVNPIAAYTQPRLGPQ